MFCANCGKELADDAKFCAWCGTQVMHGESEKALGDAVVMPVQEKKNNGKLWIVGAAAVVILLGVVFGGNGIGKPHQGQEDHKEKTVAGAKAVRIDDMDEAVPEDAKVQEREEASGTRTENPVVREAGLYQSNGSFIPWDDLGIDVETRYTYDNCMTEDKSPCKVFADNNYDGELVFPDNITEIGDCTFWMCTSLESIDLPDTLTSIGETAFWYCESLKSVDLSNTQITSIGDSAFGDCHSLTSVDLPDTLTSIGKDAFAECESLTSIDLSNTQITSIEYQAFLYAALENIDLPDSLTSIGYDAFAHTSLKSIDLPDSLKSIDLYVFAGTPLTNINYAGTMREWENIKKAEEWYTDMFNDSFLETITCSDGVIDF